MNINSLIAFCKVVELKSFSRAAECLGVSQPAVSSQIKNLERYFDVKLLHRGGAEIVPTVSGTLVYENAIKFTGEIEKLRQSVKAVNSHLGGKLSLGASTGPGANVVPVLLGSFKSLYPQIEISFEIGDSSSIAQAVMDQRLEFGYVGSAQRNQSLKFEPFVADELILTVYPEHPWAERESVDLSEIQKEPLILQQAGSGATLGFFEVFKEYGLKRKDFNVSMELGLQESVKAAVGNGFGVTFLSRLGAENELRLNCLVEVPVSGVSLSRTIYLLYRKSGPLSNLAELFIKYANESSLVAAHKF